MKRSFSRSLFVAGVLPLTMLGTMFPPPHAFANDESSYYDATLEKVITFADWKNRDRNLAPDHITPGETVEAGMKNYTPLECADFSIDSPDNWITSYSSSTGQFSATAPLDAKPGDYEIRITDSSECFPQDAVETTWSVKVDHPDIQYKINEKEELVAILPSGEEKVLEHRAHNAEDLGIEGYTIADNGVMSVKMTDGQFHNLYGNTKKVDYKDNYSKGIFNISYDNNGNGIIIATDGSMYVIDDMKSKNLSITSMSVVGNGRLVVATSDGTSYNLGVLRESIYEGISSVSMGANKDLVISTTGGYSYVFNEDNSFRGKKPYSVTSISLSDNAKRALV